MKQNESLRVHGYTCQEMSSLLLEETKPVVAMMESSGRALPGGRGLSWL